MLPMKPMATAKLGTANAQPPQNSTTSVRLAAFHAFVDEGCEAVDAAVNNGLVSCPPPHQAAASFVLAPSCNQML